MFGIEKVIGGEHYIPTYSKWLTLASSEAWKSNFKYKMSAIIYRGSTIYSVGHNEIKDSIRGYWQCSIHAEMSAIDACQKHQHQNGCKGLKMLVYRFRKMDKELAPSKPCERCMENLEISGIKQVICLDKDSRLIKINI